MTTQTATNEQAFYEGLGQADFEAYGRRCRSWAWVDWDCQQRKWYEQGYVKAEKQELAQ